MKIKTLYWIVLCDALLNMILAGLLYIEPHTMTQACSSSCNAVLGSGFAEMYGIPQALIGLLSFAALAIFVLYIITHPKTKLEKILPFILLAASLYAARLIYIQAMILETFCPYCMTIDTGTILVTILVFVRKYVFPPKTPTV